MTVEQNFHPVQSAIQVDEAGYINLGQAVKGKSYRLLVNDAGQILLDPIEHLPEREQWLWQNEVALNSVQRGVTQVATGERQHLGSFAQYADLEIDD